jgi:hypothetical protein
LKKNDEFLEKIGVGNATGEYRAEILWFSDAVYRGELGLFERKK